MRPFLKDRNVLFPITLVAFVGPAIHYVNLFFNSTTRWLVLALLFASLLRSGKIFRCLHAGFGIVLFANIIWCLLTAIWSEAPELTLAKSVAFTVVTLTVVSGGMEWARTRSPDSIMAGFSPLTVLAIFAGVFGSWLAPGGGERITSQVTLYQGLAGNPNMLGMLAAMGFPYAMWRFYWHSRPGAQRHAYWISVGMVASMGVILVYSMSRASFLVMFSISLSYLLAEKKRRQAVYLLMVGMTAAVAVVAAPDFVQEKFKQFLYKGHQTEDVLFSREGIWDASFEQGLKGGWIGGGYGVTIGETTKFEGGLTAYGYGREKGNTQFAIMEELGLVGLGLYGLLIANLFWYLSRTFKRIRGSDERVAFGIVTGAIGGMILNSVFEAWWVAPGSPEAPYFWGLVGIALSLGRIALQQPKVHEKFRIDSLSTNRRLMGHAMSRSRRR